MRKYRLRIGLDVDDVLYECNSYALELLRRKYGDNPAFDLQKIRSWGLQGNLSDERLKYFADPEFVASQPMFKGAQKFVHDLCEIADVFFVTAVPSQCMSARAKRLREDFPEVPAGNLLIGTRKDIVNLDILLDDAAHNISSSQASYPVLMRRPWNSYMSGLLSVNSYSDFIHLARIIGKSFVEKRPDLRKGGVLCLVGPSGTGKTRICSELIKDPRFVRPMSTTTRPKLKTDKGRTYRFVSTEQFIKEKEAGRFIETTVYSSYYFGTSDRQISPIVKSGKIAVIPIDICGAISLKKVYRSRACLVFTDRSKQNILMDIISRDITDEDKVHRMMSLDLELRNIEFCDFAVRFDEGLNKCVENIHKELQLPASDTKENN